MQEERKTPKAQKLRIEPLHVLMCTPVHFDIVDEKNIHMRGFAGTTDHQLSQDQWNSIYEIYRVELEAKNINGVKAIEGIAGCEDMVFAANQSFPWIDENGNKLVVLSRMKYPSRQKEVPVFETYYRSLGYSIIDAPGTGLLEGMGDLIPIPGKRVLFGGYGHRTDKVTLDLMQEILKCEVIPLQLINDNFYHLDTCFIPLNDNAALYVRSAFNEEGIESLQAQFETLIEIPDKEAEEGFALNAHIVNGTKYPFAIIQEGNPITQNTLADHGFKVYTVNTSEFIKSGGSVFCMKMMHY